MKIALDDGKDVEKAVEDGLTAFNRRVAGTGEPIPVNVTVRDDAGIIVGGIVARVWMETLYIGLVWIDDPLRGKGHGKAMMDMVEARGREVGATNVWLNTLSWQARPFYEALGYTCFGEMPISSGQHHRYFMRKEL